ncbi:MAG: hypothetical protein K5639_08460 [Eubacterium sp.]|nr:hypothetical protein [Eubacterium sp.]
MYTISDRVSYSRIGKDGKIGVAEMINCLQDCALFHSEDIGHSAATLAKRHRAWLVSAWDVIFVRRPMMAEEFFVHTWPYKMTNLFGQRNFLVETPEKEVLAYADSRWFFFDSENMKPAKVDDDEKEAYKPEPAYEMDYSSRKVKIPDGLEMRDRIEVTHSCLDTNDHMNNGKYVEFAVGYIPADFEVKEFRAEYKNAAKLGVQMVVNAGESDGLYYVVYADEEGNPYFISEFTPA